MQHQLESQVMTDVYLCCPLQVVVWGTMGCHLHTAPCLSNLDQTAALLTPGIQSPTPVCQSIISHFKIFLCMFRKYLDILNMTEIFILHSLNQATSLATKCTI